MESYPSWSMYLFIFYFIFFCTFGSIRIVILIFCFSPLFIQSNCFIIYSLLLGFFFVFLVPLGICIFFFGIHSLVYKEKKKNLFPWLLEFFFFLEIIDSSFFLAQSVCICTFQIKKKKKK